MDLSPVLPRIEEHVGERISNLAWGSEQAVVVAPFEDGSTPSTDSIHEACEPRADALHAVRKRPRVARLDDQMRVIPLQRVTA